MDTKPDIEIPGLELREFLGRGASASVWAGVTSSGEELAVKVFQDPHSVEQAFDEAGILARFKHPNVVEVRSIHRTSNAVAVIMDRLPLNLAQYIVQYGPLRGAQVVGLVQGVCAGLSALHERGLVHGDVSPTNVGLTWDGVAQLLDFGAVRDELNLGTPGFSDLALPAQNDARLATAGAARDIERRMHRLLGGTVNDRSVDLPGGLERQRADVLGAARLGLFALGRIGIDGEPTALGLEVQGSVAHAVAGVLEAQLQRAVSGGEGIQFSVLDLADSVGEVIPAAPIAVPSAGVTTLQHSAQVLQTRRAAQQDVATRSDLSALWGETEGSGAKTSRQQPIPRSRARSTVLGAAIVVGLAAIAGGVVIGTAESAQSDQIAERKDVMSAGTAPAHQTPEDASSTSAQNAESIKADDDDLMYWQQIVSELGSKRDAAITSQDLRAFMEINIADSPAARADSQMMEGLQVAGLKVTELSTTSTVHEVIEFAAGHVVLKVETAVESEQQELAGEDDFSAATSSARASGPNAPQIVEMVLVHHEGRWLVHEIKKSRAGAD